MKIDVEIKINWSEKPKFVRVIQNVIDLTTGKDYGGTYLWTDEDNVCSWLVQSQPEYSRLYLVHIQNYLNQKLKMKGCVVLNDVYDALGLPKTPIGEVCGWSYDSGNGLIDLGLFNYESNAGFINGFNNNFTLKFNVPYKIF